MSVSGEGERMAGSAIDLATALRRRSSAFPAESSKDLFAAALAKCRGRVSGTIFKLPRFAGRRLWRCGGLRGEGGNAFAPLIYRWRPNPQAPWARSGCRCLWIRNGLECLRDRFFGGEVAMADVMAGTSRRWLPQSLAASREAVSDSTFGPSQRGKLDGGKAA